MVDSIALSHEHDLQTLSLWVVVDELSQTTINRVFLDWDVDSNSLLEFDDVVLQSFILAFSVLQVSEELERCLVSLVDLVLKLEDIVRCCLLLTLQGCLLLVELFVAVSLGCELDLDVYLLDESSLLLEDDAAQLDNEMVSELHEVIKFVDFGLEPEASFLCLSCKSSDGSILVRSEFLKCLSKFVFSLLMECKGDCKPSVAFSLSLVNLVVSI